MNKLGNKIKKYTVKLKVKEIKEEYDDKKKKRIWFMYAEHHAKENTKVVP